MTSFSAQRGGGWAMMTDDDERGGDKNCRFFDDVICERPLGESTGNNLQFTFCITKLANLSLAIL